MRQTRTDDPSGPDRGSARARTTRTRILDAAERLFAEHGVLATSNRQVAEAAGQGNTAVVGYHFGTKTDLVRAIVRRHSAPIEQRRARMLAEVGDSAEVRHWVACLVRPATDHLAALGDPTWYARFGAQVMTDPVHREIMLEESLSAPTLQQAVDGLTGCLPALPREVHVERNEFSRHLIVHVLADRERALADGTPTPRASWQDATDGLIDAVVGIWQAPVTAVRS